MTSSQEELQKLSSSAAPAAAAAAAESAGEQQQISDKSGLAAEVAAEDSQNNHGDAAETDNGQVEPLDASSVDNSVKAEPVISLESPGPMSDMEKKQKRAERFGVGVNFSEDEKRRLRASRFNSSGSNDKPGVAKGSSGIAAEAEKMTARAARFGTVKKSGAEASSEEAKKKARTDRFSGVDSNLEAEKKKARAARFASGNDEELKKKKLRTDTAVVATAAQG